MPNILDILARAQSLKQETALNSISPSRAGGIMYDTLIVLNQMQLEGGSLLISKVYLSVAAMEADTHPTSDLTGRALRAGQLVVIVPTNTSSDDLGSVYRYNGPGSWSFTGKIGGLPLDTVPTQNSTNGITSGAVYNALTALKNEGYKYMGIATPGDGGTTPGTPHQPVFYVAGPGTYPNFGGLTVASGYLGMFSYNNSSWSVQSVAVGKDYDAQIAQLDGQISQLDLEVNGSTGDKDITPTMAQGYYYTVSGSTIRVTNAATSWYSGDASTTPPTNGVDVSAYAGKTIKVVVTNRSGTSTRCCAVLNASNSVVKSWKESEFATDDAMYSYSFVVPSTGKWLFLSGSSTFALDSVVVVDGEVIIGLSDRMDNVENDIEGIDTEIEGIGTAIEGIQSDIEDAQDDISDLDTQINGGTSADTDVTPTTATGYYYLASGSTIKIMSAGTAHYSGIVTDTSTPPSGGLDVSSYVGKQIKIVVTSILGTSTRLTCILDAQMDVLASVEEQDFTLEDTKYVATLNVPIGAKWFFFSGSSVCILESVKVLGTEVPGLVDRVEDLENESETKSLKVLLLGSSFGVNTIVQFPALAIAGGIDCVCGNLYQGGVTLAGIVSIINGNGNFQNGRIYTKETNSWQVASKNIDTMLGLYKWDIIILQRAAPNKTGGSDTWTSSMASDLETIIQYIASHTTGSPKIMFNSVFGRSVGYFNGSRENQIASAELIMSTAREMQEQFGLEVIPAAVAIQNARNTSLSYVTTENTNNYEIPDLTGDGEHLDTGVGSYILGCLLYEQIIGKRFDKSILEMTTLPTLANVTGNGGFVDADFTQITASEARIARYAAMLAVREPWTINTALGELYPYPTT